MVRRPDPWPTPDEKEGRLTIASRRGAAKVRTLFDNRLIRNFSALVMSGLGAQALGMLATIRGARALAPGGYGQYNLVQTIAGLGAVIAGLGLRNVVIRECARHP